MLIYIRVENDKIYTARNEIRINIYISIYYNKLIICFRVSKGRSEIA